MHYKFATKFRRRGFNFASYEKFGDEIAHLPTLTQEAETEEHFQEELLGEEGVHDVRQDGSLPALGPPPEEPQEGGGGGRALPLLRPVLQEVLLEAVPAAARQGGARGRPGAPHLRPLRVHPSQTREGGFKSVDY